MFTLDAPVHFSVHYISFRAPVHHHRTAPHRTAPQKSVGLGKSYLVFAPCFNLSVMGKTGAERLRDSLERKKQKKRERNARFYEKNKDKILKERKEQRKRKRPCVVVEEQSEGKLPKPNWRLYKARQRARKKQEREMTSFKNGAVSPNDLRELATRTGRNRALKPSTKSYA